MVVLSAGMRKAGSLWYYSLIRDLLVATGHAGASDLDDRFPAAPFVADGKMKCGRLTVPTLARLGAAAALGRSFPVKTHSRPHRGLRLLMAGGRFRATYVYRDPRDVALSLLDHARHARAEGVDLDLTSLDDLRDALVMVERELDAWEQWMDYDEVLKVRYEDLVADTSGEVARLADHLGVTVSDAEIEAIAAPYDRRALAAADHRPVFNAVHFNKGRPGRHRSDLAPEQRALCEARIGPRLSQMGYA